MLRMLAVLALVVGFAGSAGSAGAAVMVDGPGEYGIMEAPMQESSAEITLDLDGFLTITGVLGTGALNNITFSSGTSGPIASDTFTGGTIPASFAGTFDLTGGETYLLSTGSSGVSAVAFEVSEVPIPGAALLFGTAVAGLGLVRARRAKAA
jgi:hypothetical protein